MKMKCNLSRPNCITSREICAWVFESDHSNLTAASSDQNALTIPIHALNPRCNNTSHIPRTLL